MEVSRRGRKDWEVLGSSTVEQRVFTVPEIELMAKLIELDIVHFHGSLDMEVDNLFHEDAHEIGGHHEEAFVVTAFARDRSSCGHRQVDIGSHSFTAAAWLLQQLWQCSNDARTVTILVSSCPLSHSLRHGHEQVQHAELIYTQVPLVYFLAGFARCFLSIFSIGVWDRRYSRAGPLRHVSPSLQAVPLQLCLKVVQPQGLKLLG